MADGDRFDSIKADLNQALEARIGHLLGLVRAAQSLTRQIIATEDEIRRQTRIKDQLESELAPLEGDRSKLSAANQDLQRRLDATKADLGRQRSLHDELLSKLAGAHKAGTEDE
jgi:predicted  nucleic acid-binding Zn-ribbon protein